MIVLSMKYDSDRFIKPIEILFLSSRINLLVRLQGIVGRETGD